MVNAFLAEGATVHFCSRTPSDIAAANARLATQYPDAQARGTAVDVSDLDALQHWVESCATQSGRIDVVVANVSCFAMKDTRADWQACFHVDMLALWSTINAALPYLEKVKGNVVTIASVTGRDVDFTAPSPYGAMKAAVVHYTAQLAHTMAPKGVRANTCSPGNIYIEDGVWGEIERGSPELFKKQMALNPMGRMGKPEEIADAVLFLASERASFVSGTNLVVDGSLCTGVQL
ncbi:hypothetical protein LTR53_005493 [Teratosphaeriaceae sp. CCFEE 6253]|nr:hypothetical protein LTR53_005493 [Teratosphaeriaceae sp. CCFEE 6253]